MVANWLTTGSAYDLHPFFENNASTLVCPSVNQAALGSSLVSVPVQSCTCSIAFYLSSPANFSCTSTANQPVTGTYPNLTETYQGGGGFLSNSYTPSGNNGTFTFVFGQTYNFQTMLFWGWNQNSPNNRNPTYYQVLGSTNGGATFPTTISANYAISCPNGTASPQGPANATPLVINGNYNAIQMVASTTYQCGNGDYLGFDTAQFYVNAPSTGYAMNFYIGATRRISDTSGTILFLEWQGANSYTADYRAPSGPPVPNTADFVSGVACRHPSLPPTPSGNGNLGSLNVGFVDGHVALYDQSTINPTSATTTTVSDTFWTNYGNNRSD